VNYEIWYNNTTEWVHYINTSDPGNHYLHQLEPSTLYKIRIKAVDDAGFSSVWAYVQNTTDDRTEGRINGTVFYIGGPLNGTVAVNATIELDNLDDINVTENNVTDVNGYFDLGFYDFMDRYRIRVTPQDAVISGSNQTGYSISSWIFNHHEDTELELFVDYYESVPPTKGKIAGHISFMNGPLIGTDPTNVTVYLLNETLVEVANFTVNETGEFDLGDLPFGYNYTIWAIPVDVVEWNGTESGYVKWVFKFEFLHSKMMGVELEYYYNEPSEKADIYGRVVFSGGPKDGEGAPNVLVELGHNSGLFSYSMRTNETGHYIFEDMFLDSTYIILTTPSYDDHGEDGWRSGYLMTYNGPFDHLSGDHEENIALEYFEMVHPSVTLLDENGDPIGNVVVTVTVNETIYVAITDENGEAEFDELDGDSFPEGTTFTAVKDGFEDLEWTDGDEMPEMVEEKKKEQNDIVFYIVIVLVLILVAVLIFVLLSNRKASEEGYSEE